jgi:superfamily II DNA or RNA helicase
MSITLRPYQQKFADTVVRKLGTFKQVLACAATGSGKTKIFITLAKRAHAKGITVLILTEATKIYEQITAELPAGNINAKVKDAYIAPGNIYIAMAQSLANRRLMVQQFINLGDRLLIINDEAHIGTATKLLQNLTSNNALLIGFTATPDFRFAKHLPLLYQAIIIGPQPDELVTDGYLCSYRHYARVLANLDELKIKNGEFTEESQQHVFESKRVYDGLVADLRQQSFRKAIVFTASIKHCEDVYAMLTKEGFNCIRVHSKIDSARQTWDMKEFKDATSGLDICVSVGILTKGWDFPPIDMVILYRATTSLPLYLQMIGRGSRTHPGKEVFTVLDYGANYQRHGLWDAEIDWDKKWNSKGKKGEGVAPIKMCPECDFINPISSTICKNCGHKFDPAKPTDAEQEETKMIELTAKYRTLIGRKISSLNPPELAMYAKIKNKKAFAIRVAKSRTQSDDPNYLATFASCMNYARGWLWHNTPGPEQIPFTDITLK